MTNITEIVEWSPNVMLLDITTPVLGGPEGPSNTPLKQLANRTAYLKGEVERRALLAHSHAIEGVTGLQAALNGKADASHLHGIASITGLQAALDGKSATTHSHTPASLGAAAASHTHSISQISDLQASLDGKAPTVHGHTTSNITGLDTALAGKAATSHSHTLASLGAAASAHGHAITDVTGLQSALDGKAPVAHAHSATTAQVNEYLSPAISGTTAMAGIGMVVTPGSSGKILVHVQGKSFLVGTVSDPLVQLRYGTGSTPTPGQSFTGTVVGHFDLPVGKNGGYALTRMLTGLAPGVPIWIDVALSCGGGGTVQSQATNAVAMVIA